MAEIKDELELIKKQLSKHRGKGNEISAGIIGDLLKFEKDDTHAKARYRIKKCAEKYHIPLAANNNGYFIMTTPDELKEYQENLDSRIEEIKERKDNMTEFYKEWNK